MSLNRQASSSRLLGLLRTRPVTTRTELVSQSGFSKATVSEAIGYLIERGLVKEVGKRQPGRGRSQVVLELQARQRLVLGAQFNERSCRVVLADMIAGPLAWSTATTRGDQPEDFVEALAACVNELTVETSPVLGLGIGVPGLVSADGRTVVVSVPHAWRDVPICDLVETRIGLPVVGLNRAKAAAVGEYWQGKHDAPGEMDHLSYVHIGAGIVSGFVHRGELYLGAQGAAGELGHTTVQPNGLPCACGNTGCLHTVASESAILREARQQLRSDDASTLNALEPESITIADILAAVNAGDELATGIVREAARWAGIGIANLVNLENPSLVVIGGSATEFGHVFIDTVSAEIRKRALWGFQRQIPIIASQLGDDAGPIGAAAYFLDSLHADVLLA